MLCRQCAEVNTADISYENLTEEFLLLTVFNCLGSLVYNLFFASRFPFAKNRVPIRSVLNRSSLTT